MGTHRMEELMESILVELRDIKEMGGSFQDLLARVDALEHRDTIYTIQEAAKYCGKTTRTIDRWISLGKIRIVSKGCRRGILKSELDKVRPI